jgi:hypothetical protein
VQKKEKDRVLPENILDVQDPCFFWAALRLAASACPFAFLFLCDFANRAANRLRLVLLSDLWFSDAL